MKPTEITGNCCYWIRKRAKPDQGLEKPPWSGEGRRAVHWGRRMGLEDDDVMMRVVVVGGSRSEGLLFAGHGALVLCRSEDPTLR